MLQVSTVVSGSGPTVAIYYLANFDLPVSQLQYMLFMLQVSTDVLWSGLPVAIYLVYVSGFDWPFFPSLSRNICYSFCRFRLACRGRDQETSYLPVAVYVEDINDHKPEFQAEGEAFSKDIFSVYTD